MTLLARAMRTLPDRPFTPSVTSRAYNRLCKYFVGSGIAPSSRRYNVTISHERRFVWSRVAKTGTRSLLSAFHEAGIGLDAEHPMDVHYPAAACRDYFRFSVVRDPWDRTVSCWNNKVVDQNWRGLSEPELERLRHFPNFVDYVCSLDPLACDVHLRSQASVIDLNHVDYIGRFETLKRDAAEILSRVGLDVPALPRENRSRSRGRSYRSYFDDDTAARIGEHYRLEAQLFGYRW